MSEAWRALLDMHVVMAGLIAVGKTTFAEWAMAQSGKRVVRENIDDDMLRKFYEDPKAMAFNLQLHLARERHRQHLEASSLAQWQDRSHFEDEAFFNLLVKDGMIDASQKPYYDECVRELYKGAKMPDLVVYLEADPVTCYFRMLERNRDIESGVKIDYMANLSEEYKVLMPLVAEKCLVVVVDWNEYKDFSLTMDAIYRAYEKCIQTGVRFIRAEI